MNEQRIVVSDILWQRLEPHLLGKVNDAEITAKDNRMFLDQPLRGIAVTYKTINLLACDHGEA
jgi:hypothetical protein